MKRFKKILVGVDLSWGDRFVVDELSAPKHIEAQLASADLSLPARVHFVINPKPDFAIMNCVDQHDIDLIVMGTVGRAGISGFVTGNTAERLLPRIPCSLLAMKPSGFKSPVALERTE